MTSSSRLNHKQTKRAGRAAWLVGIGAVLIVVAIVLIICFFLQGKTTTSNQEDNQSEQHSLACQGKDVDYAFLDYQQASSTDIKVNATFGKSGISSISLIYQLHYDNSKATEENEMQNHIIMEQSYVDNGLKYGDIDTTFTKTSNTLQVTLFSNEDKINDKVLKYYLLDGLSAEKDYDVDAAARIYKQKGLSCETNN